jgi:hypothetical protein
MGRCADSLASNSLSHCTAFGVIKSWRNITSRKLCSSTSDDNDDIHDDNIRPDNDIIKTQYKHELTS